MRIAMTVWNDLISPVFDVSRTVRLVEAEDEPATEADVREIDMTGFDPGRRVSLLRTSGVDVLVCGAISAPLAEMVQAAGIRLVPFVTGPADAVLAAFLRGGLPSPEFALPGCGMGMGRRRRGRGRGRGRGMGCGQGW